MAKKEMGTRCSHSTVSVRGQPLRRKIQQPVFPGRGLPHNFVCCVRRQRAIQQRGGIPICASCATWSCINAISGETTIDGLPASIAAGNW